MFFDEISFFFLLETAADKSPPSISRRPQSSSITNSSPRSFAHIGSYAPSFINPPLYLNQPYPTGYLNPALFSYNMGSPRGLPMRPSFTSSLQQDPNVQASNENFAPQNSTTASIEQTDTPLQVTDLNSSPQKETESCDQQPSTGLGFQTGYSPFIAASSTPRNAASFLPPSSSHVQSSMYFPMFSSGYGLAASSNPADQSKQIALLLSELDAAKAQNKRVPHIYILPYLILDQVLKVKFFTYMYFFMKKMEYNNICFILYISFFIHS